MKHNLAPAVGDGLVFLFANFGPHRILWLQLSRIVWSFPLSISGFRGYSGYSCRGVYYVATIIRCFLLIYRVSPKKCICSHKKQQFFIWKANVSKIPGRAGGAFLQEKTRFRTTAHQNMRKLMRFWTTAHRENRKNIRFCTTAHQQMRKNVWLCICEVAKCSKILGFARMRINISLKHEVLHLWVCKMS